MKRTSLCLFLLLASTVSKADNCNLTEPPADAGETQAHGIVLYLYPRTHTLDKNYNGCQSQWFWDNDHFRKINTVYYKRGAISSYDSININGGIAYHCQYNNQALSSNSDGRCPAYKALRRKSFQAGCYSQATLDNSGSYQPAFNSCRLR